MKRKLVGILIAVMTAVMLFPANAFAWGQAETGHNHATSGYCAVCGEGEKPDTTQEEVPEGAEAVAYVNGTGYPSLQAAVNAAAAGDTVELSSDLSFSKTVYINKELTLSGGGHTIARAAEFTSDALFNLESGANVTLKDVTMDGNDSFTGQSLLQVCNGAELVIGGGVTLKNSWANYGGAVYVAQGGTLYMTSGQITACWAENSGGGIYNEGTVYLAGDCSIYGNKAVYGGGVWSSGPVHVQDFANITGNLDSTDGSDNIHMESGNLFQLDAAFAGSLGINLHGFWEGVDQVVGTAQYGAAGAEKMISDWDSTFYGSIQEDGSILLTSGQSETEPETETETEPETETEAETEPVTEEPVTEEPQPEPDTEDPEADVYDITTYQVTFNANNAMQETWTVPVNEGETVAQPEDPVNEGFNFGGWVIDEIPYDFTSPVYSDLTLMAQWTEPEPITYNVTINPNNGEDPTVQTVVENEKVIRPETDPVNGDKVFGGWYYDTAEGAEEYDFEAPVTGSFEIYAVWNDPEPVYYTVTFTSAYGTVPPEQQVESGMTAAQPEDPTADGYVFGGWFMDAECTVAYDFSTPVTQPLMLYAKWTEEPSPEPEPEPEPQPEPAPAPDPQPEPSPEPSPEPAPAPEPQPSVYRVTFSYNGMAEDPYQTQDVTSGSTAQRPEDPKDIDGYVFGGWFTDSACTMAYDFNALVTTDLYLYAKWSPVVTYHSVTFYAGHDIIIEGQSVEDGKTVEKPADPTVAGYIFQGWFTDIQYTNAYDFNAPVTKDMTLYAKWAEEETTIQYFKVSFYSERGTAPAEQTVEKGYQAVKPNDPSAEGFVFGGWYTEKECKNIFDFNTPITADVTLFAKWSEIPVQTYVISFDANGHGNTPNPQTVQTGQLVQKPADPTAVGYTFNGWYTDPSCTQAFNFKAAVTANQTLYAGWTANRYTVKFDSNGGTGVMASQTYIYDIKATLPANTYVRTGYYFTGWNTKADGTGLIIKDQAQVMNLTAVNGANIDLFAQWKNIYNVIQGANAKIQKGGSTGFTFQTDGDYNKFTGITVDGYTVPNTMYTSWAGSTYVQLNPTYVNQLPQGVHTIRFMYTDGAVETNFEIISGTPRTGDTNNALLWIIIAIVCLIIIVLIILLLLKRRRFESGYDDFEEIETRRDDEDRPRRG